MISKIIEFQIHFELFNNGIKYNDKMTNQNVDIYMFLS